MKILAVDDDPIILELLKHALQIVGDHTLVTAESGFDALEIAKDHGHDPFDCCLFDIQMPQMDGIVLARKIRSVHGYADTPVLMLTAMSDKRYIDAAFTAGATDYVTKPFEISELKARLGLVEGLVQARQAKTRKIFTVKAAEQSISMDAPPEALELYEPISLYDVDNMIDYSAMGNYVEQLSRNALLGSTAFAFSIRKIDSFHKSMSAFEFYCLISDTAEVISDTLQSRQFVMSYAGNGTFVCITESGWRPDMTKLMDAINLSLSQTELFDNSGKQVEPRVSAGDAVRLVWKSGSSIMEAVAQAHTNAEDATEAHDRAMNNLWVTEMRA
jgi:CheY-like chemotaxis protein